MDDFETRAALSDCLRAFELLGDDSGMEACRRALARLGRSVPTGAIEQLSRREWQVAELVGQGLTNRQLAYDLGIAPGTAGRHVANIMAKLGLHRRAQIARFVVDGHH